VRNFLPCRSSQALVSAPLYMLKFDSCSKSPIIR
jgi:hypothetical protein